MRTLFKCAAVLLLIGSTFAQLPEWRNGAQEKFCALGTYHDALALAFANATRDKGETLVTVQVLPSFQRETAFVFKRVGNEIKLLRVTLLNQLWAQLHIFVVRRTREQCLDLATRASVDVVEIPMHAGESAMLWNRFGSTDLTTDDCPRLKGKCADFVDGTTYVVETRDGHLLRLTDIGADPKVKSENPALLTWIREVLASAQLSDEPASRSKPQP